MLAALVRRFSLPLLAKDLVETANRRRTYILRVVYALLLYSGAFMIYLAATDALNKTGFELLGTGEELLNITFSLQCVGVCLFMPALSVGAVALEKEKNTLTLLFLTRLGPWTILFEKYLARVIHMSSYLLISLPLFGIAYSLGGVTQLELWSALWTLLVFTAQVGAISIACSTFFASTSAAFIWTYLIGAGLYILPAIAMEYGGYPLQQTLIAIWESYANQVGLWFHQVWSTLAGPVLAFLNASPETMNDMLTFRPLSGGEDVSMPLFPLNLLASTFWSASPPNGPAFWHVLLRTIPIAGTIGVCLVLARRWLVSRAVSVNSNRVMRMLRNVDGFFHRINQNSWTKGRVIINDTESLPLEQPIAWRETKKRAFGTVRYLVRMLVLIEFPVAAICLIFLGISTNQSRSWNRSEIMVSLSIFTWVLSILFLVSKAATTIPSERLGETFEVLLSTPMQTRDIVQQKIAGVTRLIWVLSIPLATITISHAIWIETSSRHFWHNQGVGWYLLGSLGAILVYPRMIAWLSMLVGLLVKSQSKAIFATLAIVAGWCVLPIVFLFVWDEILDLPLSTNSIAAHLAFAQSPAILIAATESAEFVYTGVVVVASLLEYSLITLALREICLSCAASMLKRPETRRLVYQPRSAPRRSSQKSANP